MTIVDRVGFQPTTSAIVSKPVLYDFLFKGQSTSINTIILIIMMLKLILLLCGCVATESDYS
jgi:hypothetical protein